MTRSAAKAPENGSLNRNTTAGTKTRTEAWHDASAARVWMGGYLAGAQFVIAWRLVALEAKVSSEWAVNGQGIDTLTEARRAAMETPTRWTATSTGVSSWSTVRHALKSPEHCRRNWSATGTPMPTATFPGQSGHGSNESRE